MVSKLHPPRVSSFVLTIHRGSGAPLSVRLDLKRLLSLFSLIMGLFFLSFVGSLFLFREIERSRSMQERLLELELIEQLRATETTSKKQNLTAATETPAIQTPIAAPESLERTLGRLTELSVDCLAEQCTVRSLMVPTSPGIAQGNILMVLEAEVPRIGARDPSTEIRKRFYFYPGSGYLDELTQSSLDSLEKKPFRFSKALQTNVSFKLGKLMRPLAINFYLYDQKNDLIRHERKAIELVDTDAE